MSRGDSIEVVYQAGPEALHETVTATLRGGKVMEAVTEDSGGHDWLTVTELALNGEVVAQVDVRHDAVLSVITRLVRR